MVDCIEKFACIELFQIVTLQRVALEVDSCAFIYPIGLLHEIKQTLCCGIGAPAFYASVGILYIAAHKFRVDDLIDGPLYDPMNKVLPHNKAVDGVVNDSSFIAPGDIGLIPESLLNIMKILFQIRGKLENLLLITLIPPRV